MASFIFIFEVREWIDIAAQVRLQGTLDYLKAITCASGYNWMRKSSISSRRPRGL